MESLGNKLVEIVVKDSNLLAGAPNTGSGSGFLNTIAEGLASTPLATIILVALSTAAVLSVIAIILARLHHNKARGSYASKLARTMSKVTMALSPVVVALAVVITPILTTLASDRNTLPNTPISITIDKATSLSASDITTLTLDKDATSHADIYADIDTTFNNNLGTNLLVSANNVNDPNTISDIYTTQTLIYTTGPVVAGDEEDFNVTVSITEDLPVGTYTGRISFYGEYFQAAPKTASVTYWCYARGGVAEQAPAGQSIRLLEGGGYYDDDDDYISKTMTYNLEETFTFPTPRELGLDCYDDGEEDVDLLDRTGVNHGMSWSNLEKWNENGTFYYWPYEMTGGSPFFEDTATMIAVPSQFTGTQPDPSEEYWYEDCWLNYDDNWYYCDNNDDYWDWIDDIYWPWQNQYENRWRNWTAYYYYSNNSAPVFDGMELEWGYYGGGGGSVTTGDDQIGE